MQSVGGVLLISWVFISPFAVAVAIGVTGSARELIARLYPSTLVLGWIGVVLLVGGGLALRWPAAMLVGAPLAGLAIWTRGGGGDDGGGGGSDDEPAPEGGPRGSGVDWDTFERAFWDYVGRHAPSGNPRQRV